MNHSRSRLSRPYCRTLFILICSLTILTAVLDSALPGSTAYASTAFDRTSSRRGDPNTPEDGGTPAVHPTAIQDTSPPRRYEVVFATIRESLSVALHLGR